MLGYTQSERMCRVVSPLGEDALLLQKMTASESVSDLFHLELELVSESEDLAFDQIVGKPLAVSVALHGKGSRWFHGVVTRFSQGESKGRFIAYSAEVMPWMWLLTRRIGCRIFQHLTVPDIARQIFTEHGISDYKLELVGTYPAREYCVQYRETDFQFLSRLFEHEGIAYFFEHAEKAHTLVLFDSPGAHAPCPEQATAIYASASSEGGPGEVYQLAFERELRSGAYALTDYNFEQPSLSLLTGTTSGACVGSSATLEVYDYPGSFLLPPDAETRVKCRMESEECASVRVTGESHCAAFTPGYRFDLRGHFRKATNDAYLITKVTHAVSESSGEAGGAAASYANTFSCIPHSVPYRPLCSTPAPRIVGAQTATVVGAAGQEIDVDVHGRVVVQFHWDREGKRDENSSCRVRVSQSWAGKGWGLIAHPRIGQEVVVEFLEGDPDSPLVTGRVYNGEQTPPYALPASSTQTGIKSRSSPGGGGFNEIRFEDKAGSELVYVQAEKDRSTLTKNDDSQSVGHDRSRSVGNDESVSVGNNQTIAVATDRTRTVGSSESVTIGANRTHDVGADETIHIGANLAQSIGSSRTESVGASETLSVGADRTRSVGGNETVTVAIARTHSVGVNEMINVGGAQEVTVGAARAVSVGGAQTTTIGAVHSVSVGGSQSVSVGGKQSVDVGSDAATQAGGSYAVDAGKKVTIVAADEITLKAGSAMIVLKKSGDVLIDGKKIVVKGSGDIVMKGSKILQN